jgi:hypothetical protein
VSPQGIYEYVDLLTPICGFAVANERENTRVEESNENRLQYMAPIYCKDLADYLIV